MSSSLIVALPGHEELAGRLAKILDGELALMEFRQFPDGESYVRFDATVAGRCVIVACTLDHPDEKFLTLSFVAATARELGAARLGLVAPYLAYLRQDTRFKPGEAITSAIFARMLSSAFDWLVTIDPHLHRYSGLDTIYSIPTRVLHAAPLLAQWIKQNVSLPLVIGPDAESEQWASAIAAGCQAPSIVLEKIRHGDRNVEISVPDIQYWRDRTPVLVDDIISSAHTMIGALSRLRQLGTNPAICIGVHAVFAPGACEALRAAGPAGVVTTNTISHETNGIDIVPLLGGAVRALC